MVYCLWLMIKCVYGCLCVCVCVCVIVYECERVESAEATSDRVFLLCCSLLELCYACVCVCEREREVCDFGLIIYWRACVGRNENVYKIQKVVCK
jgi:hypothetical protein